jgi:DinB superfamily
MEALQVLRHLLDHLPSRLEGLSHDDLTRKPAPDRWSPQEEFGHLLDSASNNHQRIVRIQLEDKPAMPGYDGDRWVELHRYQQREWRDLVAIWHALNGQLLAAALAAPKSSWQRTCTIANSQPVTLAFVFEDYLHHMLHHLRHIGVELDDLVSSMPALLGGWQAWPEGKPPQQAPARD